MAGIWITHARCNGGPMVEAGPLCHLQLEVMFPKVLLPFGGAQKPTGMRALLQNAAFAPEDGLFECWGPNNPDGITDPVHPHGYVSLLLMRWDPVTTDELVTGKGERPVGPEDLLAGGTRARVPGAFTGEQLADEVRAAQAAAEEVGGTLLNGWAAVTDIASPADLAAASDP